MSESIVENYAEWLQVNFRPEFTPEVSWALKCIIFNPVFWNVAAQLEFRTGLLTKIAGNKYRGCYVLAVTIFSLGIYRDLAYHAALATQPVAPILDSGVIKAAGAGLIALGNLFVLSSMWALGITGTYLGDYFGILMDGIVTGFPFNVLNNPMYVGSYFSFLGYALWSGKAMGLLLSMLVWAVYSLALKFEEPFTARIYAERDALAKAQAKAEAKKKQ